MDGKSSAPLRIYLSPSDKVEKKTKITFILKSFYATCILPLFKETTLLNPRLYKDDLRFQTEVVKC